jgi:hypothetical protein
MNLSILYLVILILKEIKNTNIVMNNSMNNKENPIFIIFFQNVM